MIPDLNLLHTLILGSYAWTVMVGYGLYKLIDRKFSILQDNHLKHLEDEIRRLIRSQKSKKK